MLRLDHLGLVMAICTLMLPVSGGVGSDCRATEHLNGTVTFYILKPELESQEYSWRINGIVKATETSFDSTTVQSQSHQYVTFKRCHENVSYKNALTAKIVDCSLRIDTDNSITSSGDDTLKKESAVYLWALVTLVILVM